MIKIAIVLERCEEGGFAASVPTIPGCFSQGETVEEAFSNIAEAIELHLEAVEDDLIVDKDSIIRELSWERVESTALRSLNGPHAESYPRRVMPRAFTPDPDDEAGDPK